MSHPRMPFSAQPDDVGLYRRDFEHDACGVAMVATLRGTPVHDIVYACVSPFAKGVPPGGRTS